MEQNLEALASAVGFDPQLGAAAGIALLLSKLVFYPVAQLRRRAPKDPDDADEGTGRSFVPLRLQGAAVFLANAGAAAGLAAAMGMPILAAVSAASTGLILARVGHEASRPKP